MKALSLIEPWASLVVLGKKQVETRSWRMPDSMRGQVIAIHASKSREAIEDGTASELFSVAGIESPDSWPLGKIVGFVTLVRGERTEVISGNLSENELMFGNYSPGRFAWIMKEPLPLLDPVPCRGMLGLWDVPLEVRDMLAIQVIIPTPKKG